MPTDEAGAENAAKRNGPGLVPPQYLRAIAVWSLIPSYSAAGGFMGYFVDRWAGSFPWATLVGLVGGLAMATADMFRLKDMM